MLIVIVFSVVERLIFKIVIEVFIVVVFNFNVILIVIGGMVCFNNLMCDLMV